MKITELRIENFRCFKKAKLRIAPVTLITGANSAGKSSLVAPLLAWAQTDGMPALFSPNGRHVEMGDFREMVHGGGKEGEIGIGVDIQEHPNYNEKTSCDAVFGPDHASSDLRLRNLVIRGGDYSLRIEDKEAKYRFGPSDVQLLARADQMRGGFAKDDDQPDYPLAGQLAGWLDWIMGDPMTIDIEGYLPTSSGEPVQGVLPVSDPVDFGMVMRSIARVSGSFAPYYVAVLMDRMQNELSFVSPFGPPSHRASDEVAQTVAQLNPGSMLVVAHPETHLDPEAQAQLAGCFVESVKGGGVTFVAETHSEYLIHRLRRLVATGEIAAHNVSVAHVEKAGREVHVHPVEIRADGRIVGAPEGFFRTHMT